MARAWLSPQHSILSFFPLPSVSPFPLLPSLQGRDLAAALKLRQHELRAKKLSIRDQAAAVNGAKAEIDKLAASLALKRSQKPPPPPGAGDGGEVTDAEEYELAAQLRQAKLAYRAAFDGLRVARADTDALAGGVQAAREELVGAFEGWYAAARAAAARGVGDGGAAGAGGGDDEEELDDGEKFERMFLDRILKVRI